MGLFAPPSADTGWRAQDRAHCHLCGAQIYVRHQRWGDAYGPDFQLLFRHGEEGGATLQLTWSDEQGAFVFGDEEIDRRARHEEWWVAWHEKIHVAVRVAA